jgi:FtsP/CotA-like multicopper oxidase with cupredoxin domain
MGLYGAMTHDAAVGEVYAGITYNVEQLLLYSEIDPELHMAVDGGTYGTPPMTSTMYYMPRYFLVNGDPYPAGTPTLAAGVVGNRVLCRFLNAGIKSHVPNLLGMYMSVVAEDGSVYLYPPSRYSLFLAAGQTRDAILTASTAGTYGLYDRMLNLSNAGSATAGGMMSLLVVSP